MLITHPNKMANFFGNLSFVIDCHFFSIYQIYLLDFNDNLWTRNEQLSKWDCYQIDWIKCCIANYFNYDQFLTIPLFISVGKVRPLIFKTITKMYLIMHKE